MAQWIWINRTTPNSEGRVSFLSIFQTPAPFTFSRYQIKFPPLLTFTLDMGDRFAEELARDNAEWGARRRGEQIVVASALARTPSEIRRARQRNIAQRNTAAPPKKSTLTPSHHRTSARSPSPTSSSASGGDFPSHYTTPGTSVAATPSDSAANLLVPRRHATRSRSKIGGTIRLIQTINTTAASRPSTKRKRGPKEESDESEGGVSVIEDLDARAIRALSIGDEGNYNSGSVDDDEDGEYEDGEGTDEDSDYEDGPRAIAKPAARAPRNRRPTMHATTPHTIPIFNLDRHSDSELSSVPDGVSGLSENDSDIEEVDNTGQPVTSIGSTQPAPTPVAPSRAHLTGRRLRAHIRGYNSRVSD
jgi:hypothetical protein